MAEIPIEKKSGIPGWVWALLAALLAALLLWWLLSDDDDEYVERNEVVATDTVAPAAVGAAAGTAAYAVGQTVDLNNVRVVSVPGDMMFTVDANGQNMTVLFNEEGTPNTATEGRIDINPGMVLNLDGQIRSASDALPTGVTADSLGGAQQYLYATGIEVVSRP